MNYQTHDFDARYYQPAARQRLPIYEWFPEYELDTWSDETIAAGKMLHKNVYQYDSHRAGNEGMYSDRMRQWDAAKYEAACKHLPRGWWAGTPDEFTAMLTAYIGHQVYVTQVIRMQNAGGFDLWYLAYHDPQKSAPSKKAPASTP